ncbi:hypothetical protein MMC08_003271 [Hypocenomyce scalaris]|nr:hypothetical protein [Hypocenomyce scalaris]
MVLGLLIQNLAYAVITPLYLILHLSTSPTTISPSPADISVDIFNLISIPISITIGYVLPAVLLALPAPSVLTFGRKQILMAIWQVFPISVDLLQRIIPVISSTILKGTDKRPTPPTSRAMGYIRAMRGVYLFALILSGFTHISAMTLTATSKFFSGLFAPEYVGIFNPSRVFFPRTISTATQMPSIGHGTLMLLQYDGLIGSASLLIWASALFVRAYGRRRIFDRWLSLVAANVLLTGLMGPVGCVVALIWARDELLLSGSEVYAEKSM